MRKIVYTIYIVLISSYIVGQASFDFTIHTVSTSSNITCANQAVDYKIRCSSTESVSYSWVGALTSYTGSLVSINTPGTYTVHASTPSGFNQSKIISVGTDLLLPGSNINPVVQYISCNNVGLAQVTASSTGAGTNVSHHFMSPYGGSYVANTYSTSYTPAVPGTYTHVLVNNDNGCTSTKTFVVNSTSGFPTFNVSSPSNYTLGCGTKSVITVSIENANTFPIGGGPLSYTILGPQTSSNIASGTLSSNKSYVINAAGNYTLITRDNTNLCETRVPVSIIQNTMAPDLNVFVPTQVLDCHTSQINIEAYSSVNNVSYNWLWQGNVTGAFVSDNILITTTSQTFNTVVNIYTLVVKNPNSGCASTTVIPIYQNLFKPNAVAHAGTNKLTCTNPAIVLVNQSSSSIPPSSGFANNQPVVSRWKGPLSQSFVLSSSYTAATSGFYVMEAQDKNNGCKSTTSFPVFNEKIYPVVNTPVSPPPFCINATSQSVFVYPIITQNTTNLVYQWSGPPFAALTAANGFSYSANALGIYSVVVTNTVSGCSTMGQVIVANCYTGISENTAGHFNVSVYPNPSSGLFTVDYDNSGPAISVEIYNALGKLISTQILDVHKSTIDLAAYPNGIYTAALIQKNQLNQVVKLVKN